MKRTFVLLALLLTSFTALHAADAAKPNILFIIADDADTLWHTKFSDGITLPPHELVIDLGAQRSIRGFVYLGRQDDGWNGAVKDAEFCVSDSPDKFGAPVAKTALAKSKAPQKIECPATKGRYVLLRALSSHSEGQYATVAELGVVGE
jgi:F5/8 type C domain